MDFAKLFKGQVVAKSFSYELREVAKTIDALRRIGRIDQIFPMKGAYFTVGADLCVCPDSSLPGYMHLIMFSCGFQGGHIGPPLQAIRSKIMLLI